MSANTPRLLELGFEGSQLLPVVLALFLKLELPLAAGADAQLFNLPIRVRQLRTQLLLDRQPPPLLLSA